MTWSLNEIESLARTAARGAGMEWGPAEEAGRAARWLCSAGWPGAEALAALLAANDGVPWGRLAPDTTTDPWRAAGGRLCPVAAGTALCDRARLLAGGGTLRLGPTAHPVLLIPFMAMAADLTGAALRIDWAGVTVTRDGGVTRAEIARPAALSAAAADMVHAGPTEHAGGARVAHTCRGGMDAEASRLLQGLARRTLAPATPESRLSGAGAGLADND